MHETYGMIFSEMVDRVARFEERPDIFRRLDISRNHFYKVTNPNSETNSGNPYPFPTEWGVKGTVLFQDYAWLKAVCKDCGCLCITPIELAELQECDPEKAISLFQKILGIAKGKK